MRLTIGQLRRVIREEVVAVRKGRLHEASAKAELQSLAAVAAEKGDVVDFEKDVIVKMSPAECADYGYPAGSLRCNVGGVEPYIKFPKSKRFPEGKWQHESDTEVDYSLGERPEMTPEQMKDFDLLAQEEGWTEAQISAAAASFRQAGDQAGEIPGMKRGAFVINGPIYAYVWKGRRGKARWENMDDLYS